MKLRNKKTGIIGELHFEPDKEYHFTVVTEDPADVMIYKKLAGLYADWEDYEEPKKYWYITGEGDICRDDIKYSEWIEERKQIGNYFETKEEAEKAVEKLKAWKRLKDKGFRFTGINDDENSQELITQCGILCEADIYHLEKDADFLLLFGGEE